MNNQLRKAAEILRSEVDHFGFGVVSTKPNVIHLGFVIGCPNDGESVAVLAVRSAGEATRFEVLPGFASLTDAEKGTVSRMAKRSASRLSISLGQPVAFVPRLGASHYLVASGRIYREVFADRYAVNDCSVLS